MGIYKLVKHADFKDYLKYNWKGGVVGAGLGIGAGELLLRMLNKDPRKRTWWKRLAYYLGGAGLLGSAGTFADAYRRTARRIKERYGREEAGHDLTVAQRRYEDHIGLPEERKVQVDAKRPSQRRTLIDRIRDIYAASQGSDEALFEGASDDRSRRDSFNYAARKLDEGAGDPAEKDAFNTFLEKVKETEKKGSGYVDSYPGASDEPRKYFQAERTWKPNHSFHYPGYADEARIKNKNLKED